MCLLLSVRLTPRGNSYVGDDIERLKQRISLLDDSWPPKLVRSPTATNSSRSYPIGQDLFRRSAAVSAPPVDPRDGPENYHRTAIHLGEGPNLAPVGERTKRTLVYHGQARSAGRLLLESHP